MSRVEEAMKRAGALSGAPDRAAGTPPPATATFPTEGPEPPAPSPPPSPSKAQAQAEAEPAGHRAATAAPRPHAHLEAPALRWQFGAAAAEKLVVMPETSPVSAEQYRKLAAALHQVQMERGSKVVMVASALAGEGKTLTAVNLALTLSESYRRRVLLVDADLRRPRMHDIFAVSNVSGLTDGLKSQREGRLSVIEISPRLVLLPAGKPDPDPMSLLTSERMQHVLAESAAAFDWVIVDTPPVVLLPDGHLLARMVDLAVLVVEAGGTPHAMIARAVEILGRDLIAGVVLNGADESAIAAAAGYAYGERNAAYVNGAALEHIA